MMTQSAKFTRKQGLFLAAMLTARTINEACESVGVSESTGYRWWKDPEFQIQFRAAKGDMVERAMTKLQEVAYTVVETLYEITIDDTKPTSARVSAGRTVLEYLFRGYEMEQIQERIEALEQALGIK